MLTQKDYIYNITEVKLDKRKKMAGLEKMCRNFLVNGFVELSANISGSIRDLFCIVFFYCWLAFVFGKNLCVAEDLWSDWLESLEVGVLLPLALPAEINYSP